jgi:CHASE3 domain sensor protein
LRLWLKGLGIVALALAPLAFLVVSIRSLQSEQWRAIEKQRQTVQVYREIQAFRTGLMGAESSVGTFLLQGREGALEAYKTARVSVPARLGNLETLMSGDGVQYKRLERLQPLLERRFTLLANLLKYAAVPGSSPPNPPPALMAEGKAVMGEIQSILGEIQREEDLRLERLSEQAWSSQRRTDVLVLGATAFLVLGGIAGAWLLAAGAAKSERRRAEEALQASQGQLRDLLKGAETQVLELAASEKVLRFQTGVLQSVLNGMSDGVVVVGEDGGLLMSNSAAGRILEGLPATHSSKWVARYGLCLADGTSACPAAEFPLARALRGEEVDHAVLFASTARGLDGAWLSMSARPMRGETGAVKGGILVITDITPHKVNEKMLIRARQEAERAKEEAETATRRMLAAQRPAPPPPPPQPAAVDGGRSTATTTTVGLAAAAQALLDAQLADLFDLETPAGKRAN